MEASENPAALVPRRRLVLGGEAFHQRLAEQFRSLGIEPGRVLYHYGPSEATVGVATFSLDGSIPETVSGTVPIGRPLMGTRLYVLDTHLRPRPIGVAGELYIAGTQVTRGYLGRPSASADRFVPDHLSAGSGARMFRTGDRVRWLPGGVLEFIGRLDNQVKVRGYRIEPGEVEAAIARHPSIRQAAVVVHSPATGGPSLVAYLVADDTIAVSDGAGRTVASSAVVNQPAHGPALDSMADSLREFLRDRLPAPMIPSRFMWLDSLPRTANGKIDRRALPDLNATKMTASQDFVAPQNAIERVIAALWSDSLGVERVGQRDNFFDLGGHSLQAIGIAHQLGQQLGQNVNLVDLFRFPTVQSLAAYLDSDNRSEDEKSATREANRIERQEAGKARMRQRLSRRRR